MHARIASLAGKQIDAAVLKPSESKGQMDAGLVKPIAVFANERLKALPDVPTFKEKGYNIYPHGQLVQMAYLVAPAATPPARSQKDSQRCLADSEQLSPELPTGGGRRGDGPGG